MYRLLIALAFASLAGHAAAETQVAQATPGAAARALGQRVGVTGAVRGAVQIAPAGGAVGEVARSGAPVHLGDRVRSGPEAGLQVILLDETVFSIGPDAELVIDEFVYDPKTDAGTVAASVTKGAFRFITGRVAIKDPRRMNVHLPQATIGVRGTMVAGEVRPAQNLSEVVLLGPGPDNSANDKAGAIVVSNAAGSVMIERAGFATVIANVAAPTPPVALPPERVRSLSGQSSVSAGPRPAPPPGAPAAPGPAPGGRLDGGVVALLGPGPRGDGDRGSPPPPPRPPLPPVFTTFEQLAQVPSGNAMFTIAQNPITLTATGTGSGFFGYSAVVNHAMRTLTFQVNANLSIGGMPFNGQVYSETLTYGSGGAMLVGASTGSGTLQTRLSTADVGDAPRFAPFFTTGGRAATIDVAVQNNASTGRLFHQGTVTLTVTSGANSLTGSGTAVRP